MCQWGCVVGFVRLIKLLWWVKGKQSFRPRRLPDAESLSMSLLWYVKGNSLTGLLN